MNRHVFNRNSIPSLVARAIVLLGTTYWLSVFAYTYMTVIRRENVLEHYAGEHIAFGVHVIFLVSCGWVALSAIINSRNGIMRE